MTDHDGQVEEAERQIVEVTITAPDADWLRQHCATLIDTRLAASANIIPFVESVYRWQGKVHQAAEALASLRTERRLVPAIVDLTRASHPYEIPHVLAKPVDTGNDDYLRWVAAAVSDTGVTDGPGSPSPPTVTTDSYNDSC